MRTHVKSLRVRPEEISRLQAIEGYFPEAETESQRLRLAFLYGLLLLEAQVAAFGGALHPSVSVDQVRGIIRARLGTMMLWLAGDEAPGASGDIQHPPAKGPGGDLDLSAADDLADLGGGAL